MIPERSFIFLAIIFMLFAGCSRKHASGAVSTSGDYQRFFMENGVRYHHLLDPSTGFPVRGLVAVTVVTDDAFEADALSTLAFLPGRERGMQFYPNHARVGRYGDLRTWRQFEV